MELWQRFTVRARRAVLIAHDEAAQMRVQLIGTEHLLLGLIRLGEGTAGEVLRALDVSIDQLRADLRRHMSMGSDDEPTDEISFTPEAQRVLQLAYAQARELNDQHIGTEHQLLGLVSEGRGAAYRILSRHGVDVARVREVLEQLDRRDDKEAERTVTSDSTPVQAGPVTPTVERVLQLAREKSEELGDEHVGTEHLLSAILALEDCVAGRILDAQGIDRERIQEAISLGEGRTPGTSDT